MFQELTACYISRNLLLANDIQMDVQESMYSVTLYLTVQGILALLLNHVKQLASNLTLGMTKD